MTAFGIFSSGISYLWECVAKNLKLTENSSDLEYFESLKGAIVKDIMCSTDFVTEWTYVPRQISRRSL